MRRTQVRPRSLRAIAGLTVFAALAVPVAPASAQTFWDQSPAATARADTILAQMTTAEKVDFVTGKQNNFYGFFNNAIPRVGIPEQTMADGPLGVRIANPTVNQNSTGFPSGTSMSASFDPALLRLVGQTLGNEAFTTGHNFLLGPSVDIARTPLWGRAFEGFGEDPLLNGTLGGSYIAGVQSNPVMATIKHFAVYDQETDRFAVDAVVSDRAMREIYGKPFDIGVTGGHPGAAMCSFNKVNGVYACENALMNTLLKGDYGFPGFIMSDYNATPNAAPAANNGLDQEQPGDQGTGGERFGAKLLAAVNSGDVSMARLDDMVRRSLRPMAGLGLLDTPVQMSRFNEFEHGQVARRVAQEGTVLLKNERKTLPLKPGGKQTIAVIGPDADNISARGGGSAAITHPTYEVSPLQGIQNAVGPKVKVTYAAGTDGITEADLLPGRAPVPSSVLRPEGGTAGQRGLHAQFWRNTTGAGTPDIDTIVPNVNVFAGFQTIPGFNAASPKHPALPQSFISDFTGRWTGTLIAPETADYELGITARGDATIRLDNAVFLQHTGALSSVSKSVRLIAGVPHTLRIDYSAPFAANPGHTSTGGQMRFTWKHAESLLSPAMRDAVADARAADVAIVVVRDYETEGEDNPSLDLPKEQDQLIRRVAAANPNTVVVVETGAPKKTSTWEEGVAAILQAWYPGQEQGNAIADLIFGAVNPSGKLPATIPVDESQVAVPPASTADHSEGVFVGYRGYQQKGIQPAYPFGFGLSYTSFSYKKLKVDSGPKNGPQGDIPVTFALKNTGNRAGAEVAQVYVGKLPTRFVDTPPRQLAAFARVELGAKATQQVSLTIPRQSFSYWDTAAQHWVVPSGNVAVYVGGSSEDAALAGTINVHP